MQITGNTILITGGGSGIGLALAEEFRKLGNSVIVGNRSRDRLKRAQESGFHAYQMDMANEQSIAASGRQILSEHPQLNGVIHCAGIMKTESLVTAPSPETQKETMAINLLGPMLLNNLLIPALLKKSSPFIMTVSSGLAFIPLAMYPAYCASKAAIHSYTESLRYQLKETAIQVMELAPPYVQTHLTGEHQASDPMAMPLDEFIQEVMQILKEDPRAEEILVQRVEMLRFAESSGPDKYRKFYEEMNDGFTKARAGVF
ncbi:MAG: SDR family oxidoreductase [Leptospiraceae bacterium]|nr:SDR family oxidoreductase [Leptospiraceae bacterium]